MAGTPKKAWADTQDSSGKDGSPSPSRGKDGSPSPMADYPEEEGASSLAKSDTESSAEETGENAAARAAADGTAGIGESGATSRLANWPINPHTGALPPPEYEYWKWHYVDELGHWHGRGMRVGPKGGGKDAPKGLHTRPNAVRRERRERKYAHGRVKTQWALVERQRSDAPERKERCRTTS